ncbi:hypothetical protein RB594_007590 [Gaeumannomyces avenae]
MSTQADSKNREFLAVIGDEDSVTGLLLAGIGHVTPAPDSQKNFLVVDSKTENSAIEAAFQRFTTDRKDIGIVLINQHDTAHSRHVHGRLPRRARNPQQRPSLRPGKGQRLKEGAPPLWRVRKGVG